MVTRPTALFASLVLPLTLTACLTSPDDADDVADDVTRHRRQWESQRITDYRVQSRLICFCVGDATEPVILQVRNRALVSVTRVSGVAVPPSDWSFRYFTIDAMFDLIADAQAKGASEVRVTYDP